MPTSSSSRRSRSPYTDQVSRRSDAVSNISSERTAEPGAGGGTRRHKSSCIVRHARAMEQQQVAESEASLAVDVKAEAEPEPQLDATVGSPTDDASKNKKKKKKKKKNRRKSLEKVEIDDLKGDKSDPEEEEATNQDETVVTDESEETTVASTVANATAVESTVAESTVETTVESAVTKESTVVEESTPAEGSTEKTTVESTVTEEKTAVLEESIVDEDATMNTEAKVASTDGTVADDTTVHSTVTEKRFIENNTVAEHLEPSNQSQEAEDDVSPPNLEHTSSIDTLKATGTKAVGSLFSRFKVGRKKPLPSRTDSAAQLELVVPSPVKTAVKKLEIPEDKSLDDLPMRTKRDFLAEGEQSVHVSTEKDKYDALEKQRKAEDPEVAARRTPPSSSRSNTEIQTQLEAAKQQIEAMETTVTDTESTVVDSLTEVSVGETIKPAEIPSHDAVVSVESTEPKTTDVEDGTTVTEATKPASLELELDLELRDDVASTAHADLLSVKIMPPASELPADTTAPAKPEKMSPVKSLASRFEGKREQSLDTLKFRTVREFFPTERSIRVGAEKQKYEAQALKAKAEGEAKSKYKLSSKSAAVESVTLATETDGYTTPDAASSSKKMSFDDGYSSADSASKFSDEALTPVKSIASRFEGKREQSLDSLKFRTVREFFPEQRSVHVGAEKAKFEAITKQQEEAKAAERKTKHVVALTTEKSDSKESETEIETSLASAAEPQVTNVVDADESATAMDGQVETTEMDKTTVVVEETPAVSSEHQVDDVNSTELDVAVTSEDAVVTEDQSLAKDTEATVPITSDDIAVSEEVKDEVGVIETVQKEEDVGDTKQETCTAADPSEDPVETTIESVAEQVSVEEAEMVQGRDDIAEEKSISELVELDLGVQETLRIESAVTSSDEIAAVNTESTALNVQPTDALEFVEESRLKSADKALVDVDRDDVDPPQVHSSQGPKSKRALLTTERSFVMEKDETIETEDTVVVGERPMTDGEDEFELLSPTKRRPAHELFDATPSKKQLKKQNSAPKLTRKVSVGSVGSAKSSSSRTTVPVPMKRASITAPTASYKARQAAEAEDHKAAQLKKHGSASKLKGTVASPTVPIPMKRASISAPTASYMARKAAEGKQQSKKSDTGVMKPRPTVPVLMKRASITAPTASWQARNVPDQSSDSVPKNLASKPSPTVPVAPKRASFMTSTASFKARKTSDAVEMTPPVRNKRYENVRSKVRDGIQSGTTHSTHKITKEEFIAAERRKSLGSAGVRSVLDVVDRRASLSARAAIDGPPEPFIRSAVSRKKLNSTLPRYLDYENSSGYAERARKQYERRKRLEEENAAKSEQRQRELRTFFNDRQQKSMLSSAEEVRRGLEAHEFAQLAKESEQEAQKARRRGQQGTRPTRASQRALSTTSASSSPGVASRTSNKSTVSSASVVEKVVAAVVETASTVVTETVDEMETKQEGVTETEVQVQEVATCVSVVDEDPELKNVAKKIDFDQTSSDSEQVVIE
ncbi:hypothetical protein PInf_016883 [Phytophthora infestans]|nr:hypothetical protein PInf_016883 [Phytophthora infestans]